MTKLEQALEIQKQVQTGFWLVYNHLVEQGCKDIKQHPDYIAADQACLTAAEAVELARKQENT